MVSDRVKAHVSETIHEKEHLNDHSSADYAGFRA